MQIESVGMPAIHAFLQKLQVFKATADYPSAKAMYTHYSAVDAEMVALRDQVFFFFFFSLSSSFSSPPPPPLPPASNYLFIYFIFWFSMLNVYRCWPNAGRGACLCSTFRASKATMSSCTPPSRRSRYLPRIERRKGRKEANKERKRRGEGGIHSL